jgi:hypothetical protein
VHALAGSDQPHRDVLSAVDEVLSFAGVQGARTVTEGVEALDGERLRVRVRVVRGEGRRDWLYDVLVQPNGLLGIYKVA